MFQPKKEKIILLGPKHVGKTSIAKQIAEQYSLPFFDTDIDILSMLQKENKIYESIAKAYEDIGLALFQLYETQAVKYALANTRYVLATGGGLADNKKALSYIKETLSASVDEINKKDSNCVVVLLKDEVNKIWNRVSKKEIPTFVKNAVQKQIMIDKKSLPDDKKLYVMYQDYFVQKFHQRNTVYTSIANIIIEVAYKSPSQLAKEIYAIL